MGEPHGSGAAMCAFGAAALALAGLGFALSPVGEALDAMLLDVEWRALRAIEVKPAADDIVIVGIDEASLRRIAEPPGLWHEALGETLVRIASAKPRAIGLDVALPERSYETVKPGLERALMVGLAAARQAAPLAAVLSIDARTRSARPIHTPLLAVLGEERLGIGMFARDIDGLTRRFSLALPTEDGAFPTLAGRLCRALSKDCADGLIHFALGAPYSYIPFHEVLDMRDAAGLERLFRDRIVLIGETRPYSDRVDVPVNYSGWEGPGRSSPGVVVHAQSLRTALTGGAPREAPRPTLLIFTALAALVVLIRDWRIALVAALAVAAVAGAASIWSLRGGIVLPLGAALFTALIAWLARALHEARRRRRAPPPPTSG